jgi:hypothetical protein
MRTSRRMSNLQSRSKQRAAPPAPPYPTPSASSGRRHVAIACRNCKIAAQGGFPAPAATSVQRNANIIGCHLLTTRLQIRQLATSQLKGQSLMHIGCHQRDHGHVPALILLFCHFHWLHILLQHFQAVYQLHQQIQEMYVEDQQKSATESPSCFHQAVRKREEPPHGTRCPSPFPHLLRYLCSMNFPIFIHVQHVRVVRLIPDDSGFGLGNSGYNFGSDCDFGSTQ